MSTTQPATPRTSKSPSKRKSVAQLLTSTKALLQSLTAWANKTASVGDVSSKFVQVGDDFKALRRSYVAGGVDTSDIKDIPNLLRKVLEESLILEPSQNTLDLFLPKVGQIVAELMKTLKEKQIEAQSVSEKRRSQDQRSVSSPAQTPESTAGPALPPPPPESTNDAISRLQNNHSLMRKASKRFSAYQTSKILSMNAVSPRQSPVPIEKRVLTPEPPSSPLQAEVSKNIKKSEIHQQLTAPSISVDEAPITNTTVFVKLGGRVKKTEISLPTTLAQIKDLFSQTYEYSPKDDFPTIYIQQPSSTVAYELEDLSDVGESVVLSLFEPDITSSLMKEMKLQTDSLKEEISKLEQSLGTRIGSIQAGSSLAPETKAVAHGPSADFKNELENIKLDLLKARQIQRSLKKSMTASIEDALEMVSDFKNVSLSPEGVISNPYMEHCKAKVSTECEDLVTRIDDLQDIIEALKLDISKRGSKPSPKQVQHVQKEIQTTKSNLASLLQYMSVERKNWNTRWQSELTAVLEEQEFFKEQETIVRLLEEDLGSADETYALIVKCVEELEKNPKLVRTGSLTLPLPDPSLSMNQVRDAVMDEVRNLRPNHDSRVEAIVKAEKVREKEREILNNDQFEDELGDFVETEKLKKSGGIDEVERLRNQKDENNLKGINL